RRSDRAGLRRPATARSDHGRLARERRLHLLALHLAERGFALLGEDHGDRSPLAPLHDRVDVHESRLPLLRHEPAHGALARTSPAVTSERSDCACAGPPVSRSTVRSGDISVEIGFIATRATSGSPVVMPPSVPPARLEARLKPGRISSCTSEPLRRAASKPSP